MATADGECDDGGGTSNNMRTTEDAVEHAVSILDHCVDAMRLVQIADKMLVSCDCGKSLANIEDTALTAASSPDFVQGLLYLSVIEVEGKTLVRYLEAGNHFAGLLLSEGKEMLAELTGCRDVQFLPAFTDEDRGKYGTHMASRRLNKSGAQPKTGECKKNRSRVGERWSRLIQRLEANVVNLKKDMDTCGHITHMILITRRINSQIRTPRHRYEVVHGFEDNLSVLDRLKARLDVFTTCGVQPDPISLKQFFDYCEPSATLSEQFALLGCISNYHWGSRPRHSKSGFTSELSHIPIRSHFSYTPEPGEGADYMKSAAHLPNSPRNLIIFYYLSSYDYEHAANKVRANLHHLLVPYKGQLNFPDNVDMSNVLPVTKKRRVQTASEPNQTPVSSNNDAHGNMAELLDDSLFRTYVQHITSAEATFLWQFHSDNHDVFIMNDMDALTGAIKPASVVHVSRHCLDTHVRYSCTCQLFQHAKCTVLSSSPVTTSVSEATCAHCRFLREHIEELLPIYHCNETNNSKLFVLLRKSSLSLNKSVIRVGSHHLQHVAKFSVSPGANINPSFVHVSRCGFVTCQSGECQGSTGVTRGIKKITSLQKARTLCPHLSCVASDVEVLMTAGVRQTGNQEDPSSINTDDHALPVEVGASEKKLFNTTTGRWEIPAFSTHTPAQESELASSIMTRLQQVSLNPKLDSEGFVTGPTKQPATPATCECGAGYDLDIQPPEDDGIRIIYTRNAAVKCKSVKLRCVDGNCCTVYSGKEDDVFFLSILSGVAEEIGWDFIFRITHSKCSFTAFCNDMTRVYETNNGQFHSFLSRPTFVSWWFAWLAAFNIDFRQNVDPFCKSRSHLACDGTHVGVTLTKLNVTPIETPTCAEVKEPLHKRFDRTFLFYPKDSCKEIQAEVRNARIFLREFAMENLGTDCVVEYRDRKKNVILRMCPQDNACKDLIQIFLDNNEAGEEVRYILSRVFHVLSGDAAVSAFIPIRYHTKFLDVCEAVENSTGPGSLHLLDGMDEYCPELRLLISLTHNTDMKNAVISFVRYLVNFVVKLHENDAQTAPAQPIPGTYDPESGMAYYFTDHGCRVRNLPEYTMNRERHNQDLYDDAPQNDDCNKFLAKVSPGGFSYTFFWFCPCHGHCLGFHIMPGAEGRRDPFSSLLAYLPDAPEEVFYDFACSFNEYSLNREPSYFRNTRFWHDLFHGFAHKCPDSLRSSRIPNLDVLDTGICEQFNAFLQNIKYTASHLTQSHFCLYLQFMIYVWNSEKTKRIQAMQNTARYVNDRQ